MSDKARKYINSLFKIVDTTSVLVVLHTGAIKRIHCPFRVVCKVDVPPLEKGESYNVEAIKMTLQLEDVFIIRGKAYYVWCFKILV